MVASVAAVAAAFDHAVVEAFDHAVAAASVHAVALVEVHAVALVEVHPEAASLEDDASMQKEVQLQEVREALAH
jgi:hypothetical protein